jgi:uncharacterized protein
MVTLDAAAPEEWNALVPSDDPFLEHAFLRGLETSGCVGPESTGWVPRHVLYREAGRLVGAMPLYEKHDSYGEYIFDWGWATASERAGVPYYPKLVSAVPFTPVSGPRLLALPDSSPEERDRTRRILLEAALAEADRSRASSLHVLFCTESESRLLAPRLSSQFHWRRRPEWRVYADFVAALRSPVRKQLKRERERARSYGLELVMQRGSELGPNDWRALRRFYESTAERKGAIAYLAPAFFEHLARAMPERVAAALARRDGGEPVAGALFLTKGDALFGRYWGADEDLPAMHFELCYDLPIEWACTHGVTRFEAGAQGEHKLKRGLLAAPTYSSHWLRHEGLARSVARFLEQEARGVRQDLAEYAAHSPYQRG